MTGNKSGQMRKVKDLNREIMMIFQMYIVERSVIFIRYIMKHPENKQILFEYFEKEFDKVCEYD
ncbi:hypothetical protein BH18THE2_BH18THE2_43880 [soil metagenome]